MSLPSLFRYITKHVLLVFRHLLQALPGEFVLQRGSFPCNGISLQGFCTLLRPFQHRSQGLPVLLLQPLFLFRVHGSGQGFGQSPVHRFIDNAFVAELNFTFLGMHIYVYGRRIHPDVQHRKGKAPLGNLGLVGMFDGLADHHIVDAAAVHQNRLPSPGAFQQGRLSDEPCYGNIREHALQFHRQQVVGNFLPIQSRDGILQVSQPRGHHNLFLVAGKPEPHVRPGQCDTGQQLRNVPAFRGYGLQKFTAGRHIVKKIPHNDGSAGSTARLDALFVLASIYLNGCGKVRFKGTGQHLKPGHGGNAGQGLAPEPQGAETPQVINRPYLAGSVALQGHPGVLFRHAAAVIRYPDIFRTAFKNRYINTVRSCIQSILHQFLHYRSRFFHNLSGSNLVGRIGVQ